MRRRIGTWSFAALLAVAGCAEAGTTGAADVVVDAATAGPGAELGHGFRVADGTRLLGDPIPIGVATVVHGEEVLDQGWTATLVVDGGTPAGIVEDHLAQAEDLGLHEVPGTGCGRDVDVWICAGFARSPSRSDPRSLAVAVVRGRRHDVRSDHVVVRYSTAEVSWELGRWGHGPDDGQAPAPPSFPPLAGVGESIGTAGEVYAEVEVQEGSRLVGPPRLNLDDASGGVVAIFEVTGDPEAVLDRYLDHLEDLNPNFQRIGLRRLRVDDRVLTRAWMEGAGGDAFELSVVERSGRPAWLAIQGSHD